MILPWRQSPQEYLDYTFDWAPVLDVGETISTATVVSDLPDELVVENVTHGTSDVTFWVSGGVLDASYTLSCEITTSGGRTFERTREMVIVDLDLHEQAQ